jgi:sugar/nucleoside kinase (ribokinase family)
MKKVMTLGGAMCDTFIQHAASENITMRTDEGEHSFIALEEGRKIEVSSVTYHAGGGAVNTAASFQKLGFDVSSFFKIGNDANGEFVLTYMRSKGIATHLVKRSADGATGISFIIPSPSGNRAILVFRGANATLLSSEIPHAAISEQDQLYVTSLSHHAAHLLPGIVREAREKKIPVAVNPGTSQLTVNVKSLEESLPGIDILILNAHEATLLMQSITHTAFKKNIVSDARIDLPELLKGPLAQQGSVGFSLAHFFHEILARGPRIVVVTNGKEGVYASDGTHIIFQPSLPARVVSSLGAGDAFGSTFVAWMGTHHSIQESLVAGSLNAASILEHVDPHTGLLTRATIEKKIKLLANSAQTFNF